MLTEDLLQKLRDNDPILTVLDLHSQSLGNKHTERLFATLKNNTEVKELNLIANGISTDGIKIISDYLS